MSAGREGRRERHWRRLNGPDGGEPAHETEDQVAA